MRWRQRPCFKRATYIVIFNYSDRSIIRDTNNLEKEKKKAPGHSIKMGANENWMGRHYLQGLSRGQLTDNSGCQPISQKLSRPLGFKSLVAIFHHGVAQLSIIWLHWGCFGGFALSLAGRQSGRVNTLILISIFHLGAKPGISVAYKGGRAENKQTKWHDAQHRLKSREKYLSIPI